MNMRSDLIFPSQKIENLLFDENDSFIKLAISCLIFSQHSFIVQRLHSKKLISLPKLFIVTPMIKPGYLDTM